MFTHKQHSDFKKKVC